MIEHRTSTDRGFTLTEVVIVVALVGLVMAVLAGAFTVIARTSPAADARDDDSRTLLGLANYLPLDISSTPAGPDIAIPGGNMSCGTSPGSPLLQLQWTDAGSGQTTQVGYRYVNNDGWRIVRYQCVGGASSVINLTSELPAPATTPVVVTEIVGDHDKDPSTTNNVRMGAVFTVSTLAGQVQRLEAVSDNVAEILPPVVVTSSTSIPPTPPPANVAPVALDKTFDAWPTQAVTVNLVATDANGDTLTADIGTPGLPAGWSASFTGLQLTVTPDPASALGPYQFQYTVDDAKGGTASAMVNVNVVATTTPTTTSTTTTTTTTTTTIPCQVPTVSVAPTSVSNGTKDNVAKLKDGLTITITKSGSCVNLVLSFVADATTGIVRELSFNDGTQVEIGKNDYSWSDGAHSLRVLAGAAGPQLNATTVTVT